MKRPLGFNPRFAILLGMIAVVLAASLASGRAAGSTPTTNSQGTAITDTGSTPGTVMAPRQRAVQTRASSSTAPASGQRTPRSRIAAGGQYNHDEIAALRERLDHQEQLLAAQQQQIAKLIATVDELKKTPNRSLLASFDPGLAANGEEVAAILHRHDLLPAVRSGDSPANPPAAAPNVGELPHFPSFASLQPLMPIDKTSLAPATQASSTLQAANHRPPIPVVARGGADASPVLGVPASSPPALVTRAEMQDYTTRVTELGKSMEGVTRGLAGFRFSSDFRLRSDTALRTGNGLASTVQNVRGRYRLRFNVDKDLSDQFDFHFTVASGRFDNGLTSDTDFAGFDTRGPIFISEASAGYHPNEHLSLRGGRLPEVFADDSRFLFKEEIRLTGFQEISKIPVGSNALGITSIEFRGGEYILTNPNLPVLPSASACNVKAPATPPVNCAYLNAGYAPGSKVRDAELFHPGFAISGNLKPGWSHQFMADMQLWRNQNQIAMAASPAAYAAVLNPILGLTLAGPITGTGTATTTPNGTIFTAAHFQIAHLAYHVGMDGMKVGDREMPLNFDFHASRNLGAGFLRDAVMGIASFGEARKAGDLRLLYGYAIKDGNSMISEATDDYLGTLSGVNIRAHEIRVDLGLTRFLAWQNYLYVVNPRRGNNPALHFYVPYPTGANTTYRVQSQLQFKF